MQVSIHNQELLLPHPDLSPAFALGKQTGCLYNMEARSLQYDDDYFLTEYESQYGKTYLDDEANLRSMARRRLRRIQQLVPPPARLLEIGCATGFFLDEARKMGYQVCGYEISDFASSYAREKLQLDVRSQSVFQDSRLKPASQNILCAFYTLEHFPDQVTLWQLLRDLLAPGGILSFALPSFHGPMLEFQPEQWEATHPRDHFIDYDPTSISKVCKLYQMRLLQTWPASYHQQRCRGWKAWLPGSVYRWYANRTCFGDTMEGLARKDAV